MGYSDRTTETIRGDLRAEFKKVDQVGYGNDDTYQLISGINVINKYKERIKSENKEVDFKNSDVFKSFDDLSARYKELVKKCSAMSNMRSNAELLQNMSNSIDNAEKKVLEKIEQQRLLNPAIKSIAEAQIKQKELGKDYFHKNEKTNSLELTSQVNAPRIHEVLASLFVNKNETYVIDYNKCTNLKIKSTMISLTGTGKCIISYNEKTKTYQLRDTGGQQIEQRALVREGVTLTPEAIVAYQAKKQQQINEYKQKESLKKEGTGHINRLRGLNNWTAISNDPYWGAVLGRLKSTGKDLYVALQKKSQDDVNIIKNFLESTEKRLDDVVLYTKQYNRKFHAEPISKKSFITGGGLMEAHLVSGSAEKDIQLFKSGGSLSTTNYNMIDKSYESEFLAYLTDRIHRKLDKFAVLDKKEDMFAKENAKTTKKIDITKEKDTNKLPYSPKKLENVSKGLDLFKDMINNMKSEFGDTWGDDDREMTSMLELLDNGIYSINKAKENANNILTPSLLKGRILVPLQKKRNTFMDYNMKASKLFAATIPGAGVWGAGGQLYSDRVNTTKYFGDLASGNRDKTIGAIRGLGQGVTTLGNTHTSHLKEEIITDSKMKLNNKTIDRCFHNLSTKLQVPDVLEGSSQKQLIDKLYNKANSSDTKTFAYFLYQSGLVPGGDYRKDNYEQILEKSKAIQTQLQENQKNIDKLKNKPLTSLVAETKKDFREKRFQLEAKYPKTEEDNISLQTYLYLEENPEALQQAAIQAKAIQVDQIKYDGVSKMFKGGLGHLLVDMAGGSKNAIYDDITGQGRFNLSDENSKMVGEIAQMIVEEIAFTVAVIALTATTGVGGAALIGARVAASVGSKLSKVKGISRMITLAKKVGTGLSKTSKYFGKGLSKIKNVGKAGDEVISITKTGTNTTKVLKTGDKVQDITKVVKSGDKVADVAKTSKNLDKIIDGTRAIDKAQDVSKVKNLLSSLKTLSPLKKETLLKDIDKVLSRGALHQVMAKTYRGQLDDDMSIWMTDILKSSSMYGVLGVVGRSAQTGMLAQLGSQYPKGLHISKLFAEEGLMFGGDLAVDLVMDTNPLPTWEEIVQNIGIGLGAEMLPFVHGGIKKMRIGKDKVAINDGDFMSTAELLPQIIEHRKANTESQTNIKEKVGGEYNTINGEGLHEFDVAKKNNDKLKEQYAQVTRGEITGDEAIHITEEFKKSSVTMKEMRKKYPEKTGEKNNGEGKTIDNGKVEVNEKMQEFNDKFDKAVKDRDEKVFDDIPQTEGDAVAQVDGFAIWLKKTTLDPAHQFLKSAWSWILSIEFKFPSLKGKYNNIKDSVRERMISKHIDIIESYQDKPLSDKIALWNNNKNNNLSNTELIAFYKMTGGESDLTHWDKVVLSHNLRIEIENNVKGLENNHLLSTITYDGGGNLYETSQQIDKTITNLKNKGKEWDYQLSSGKLDLNNLLGIQNNVKYIGTVSDRPIISIRMPDGSDQYFYKSTGGGGKSGHGINGTTDGMWQVFGGFMDNAVIDINESPQNGWFIKTKDYENYYGSKTFQNISLSLDNVLMKQFGKNNVDDLNVYLKFQSLSHHHKESA